MHYPSQIAPEVADEMAQYAAQDCSGDAGAEYGWASPAAKERLTALLQGAPAAEGIVIEEQG